MSKAQTNYQRCNHYDIEGVLGNKKAAKSFNEVTIKENVEPCAIDAQTQKRQWDKGSSVQPCKKFGPDASLANNLIGIRPNGFIHVHGFHLTHVTTAPFLTQPNNNGTYCIGPSVSPCYISLFVGLSTTTSRAFLTQIHDAPISPNRFALCDTTIIIIPAQIRGYSKGLILLNDMVMTLGRANSTVLGA